MPRILRLFILLPALLALWAAANSLGVTQTISDYTGYDIPDAMEIPGLAEAVGVRERLEEQARARAVEALRAEVSERYGPDAAALVPSDLTASEAARIAKQVASGADLKAIKNSIRDATSKADTEGTPVAARAINGDSETFNTARKQLAKIPVKGRAPKTGYDRGRFGAEWSDSAGNFKAWTRNGCDTRNDVLARDLKKVTYKSGGSCAVASGVLRYERYTGKKSVRFVSGGAYENSLDIEHLVPLSWAWQHGAQQMSGAKRAALANDPQNLFAADPSSNRQKGDSGPGAWLPRNKAYRCAYVSHFVSVVSKYGLWINAADKAAIENVLKRCAK